MERLHQRLRGKDFVMLAVSEDETGRAAVQPFVGELGISFPVLLDEEGTLPRRYGVTGYPETFIIDRGGLVVQHTIGPEHWDSEPVYRYLTQLLDSSAASAQATSEQQEAGS
jgi:peroxiredoxin